MCSASCTALKHDHFFALAQVLPNWASQFNNNNETRKLKKAIGDEQLVLFKFAWPNHPCIAVLLINRFVGQKKKVRTTSLLKPFLT